MSIIEMIIFTLIAIIGTNALAWFMIWQQVKRIEAMIEDDVIEFIDEVKK